MAWIYFQELEGSPSHSRHGSSQPRIVKSTNTHKPFFCRECAPVSSPLHPSGMMCERCGANPSDARSTSSQEDSPVRTQVKIGLALAWRESAASCFLSSSGSLASYDPDSFSWKTYQLSLFGGSTEFCWSSLRWGIVHDGQLFQPRRWEPRMIESECSSLPTPTVNDSKNNGGPAQLLRNTPGLSAVVGGSLNPMWVEWLMGYRCGWTELEDWGMQLSRPKRERLLKD